MACDATTENRTWIFTLGTTVTVTRSRRYFPSHPTSSSLYRIHSTISLSVSLCMCPANFPGLAVPVSTFMPGFLSICFFFFFFFFHLPYERPSSRASNFPQVPSTWIELDKPRRRTLSIAPMPRFSNPQTTLRAATSRKRLEMCRTRIVATTVRVRVVCRRELEYECSTQQVHGLSANKQ
jgi:hypothetical protein